MSYVVRDLLIVKFIFVIFIKREKKVSIFIIRIRLIMYRRKMVSKIESNKLEYEVIEMKKVKILFLGKLWKINICYIY